MEVASPDGKMKRVKVTIWDTGIELHPLNGGHFFALNMIVNSHSWPRTISHID